MYNAMYAAIKEQAQTPAQVVKSFYEAAMLLEDGRYKQIFEDLLGKSKGGFCSDYLPKVQEAFKKQTRCKRVSLFFVWRIVYADIKANLETEKKVAKAMQTEQAKAKADAVEALQTIAEPKKKGAKVA